MSTLVTFNSTGYLIPNAGETGWGPVVTSFLTDVGNNALTLAGTQTVTNKTIRLTAGTAAAPAIAFAGDATTGVYMPTTGQIALSAGGVQRLLIDSAGLITTSGTIHATTFTGTTLTTTGAIAGSTGTFSGAVSGTTGTFTGAVAGSTTITAPTVTSRTSSGSASLNSDGTNRGYASFSNSSAVQQGYIGYIAGTSIDIATSGSSTSIRLLSAATNVSGSLTVGSGLTVTGTSTASSDIAAGWGGASGGYICKGGLTGGFTGNRFNFLWSGGYLYAYVDDTQIGALALVSDARYKHSITPMEENAVDRMLQLEPISYRLKDKGVFKDDNVIREGFTAQDLKKVIPSAVIGDEDSDNPMSLNVIPIVAVLTKAIQELTDRIATLEAR